MTQTRAKWIAAVCLLLGNSAGCEKAVQPTYWEVLEVSGTNYERGFQHGEHFASKIRSFWTQLLETSIYPYFSRERAAVLGREDRPVLAVADQVGGSHSLTDDAGEAAAESLWDDQAEALFDGWEDEDIRGTKGFGELLL